MNDWPFADPPNVLTFTVRQIMDNERPILRVAHDKDDGMWQFLTGDRLTMADTLLVCLKNVVAIDQSVIELADLPVGWEATRESLSHPWRRVPATQDIS